MTPYDVLARRTSITIEDRQRGLGILDEVAALMARELDWSSEQQQTMIEGYRNAMYLLMSAEMPLPANPTQKHGTEKETP